MRRKTRILIQTNGQRYKQANQLSGAQMNTEHMKRCSNSLVFREIQMKTAMRYRSAIMGEFGLCCVLVETGATGVGMLWDNVYQNGSGPGTWRFLSGSASHTEPGGARPGKVLPAPLRCRGCSLGEWSG